MTEKLFNTDNGFWQAVGKAGDLILLTFLTLFASLPVITAGAALSALSYVSARMLEHDNDATIRNFFHSFRQNLAQGSLLTCFFLAYGLILWYDVWFMIQFTKLPGSSEAILCAGWAICVFLGFLYLVFLLYLFPLQARFYNPVGKTLWYAAAMGFKNLPSTLLMVIGDGAVIALTVLCLSELPRLAILPLLTGLPLASLYNVWVLRKVLGLIPGKRDLPAEDEEEEKYGHGRV